MIEKVKLDPLHSSNIEFISERWYQVQQALLMGSQRNNLNSIHVPSQECQITLRHSDQIETDNITASVSLLILVKWGASSRWSSAEVGRFTGG